MGFEEIIPYIGIGSTCLFAVGVLLDIKIDLNERKKAKKAIVDYKPKFISNLQNLEKAIKDKQYTTAISLIDKAKNLEAEALKQCDSEVFSVRIAKDKELSDAVAKYELLEKEYILDIIFPKE